MPIHGNLEKGFTLTETLVSMAMLLMVCLAAVEVIVISKVCSSISKHKMQAIFVAETALEDLHRKPFSQIAGGTSAVSIDTKATPDNNTDDLIGTRVITVSSPSTYYKKAVVEVRWNERLPGVTKSMSERAATFITNDPQTN